MSAISPSPDSPQAVNFVVSRATDVALAFALTNNAGAAIDLTQTSVQFSARDTYGGTVKVAPIVNAPSQHTDAPNGKTTFTVAKAALQQDAAGAQKAITWLYEIRLIQGSSQSVLMSGQMTIMPTVNP